MSERKVVKPVALAVGAALASTFALGSVANAEGVDNPFSISTLKTGYTLGEGEGSCGGDTGQGDTEGTCGEGSCGGDTGQEGEGEGSCGGDTDQGEGEGTCGEGSCGGDTDQGEGEGSCGEGSCGGDTEE